MNKLYLSSALMAILALPTYADIAKTASTATCDSTTIGATSGSAHMDTAWTANTINLDFYSDGEKISTGSCTYDGAIELPEDPEDKTGYTFGGWKMRVASQTQQCGLSGLDVNIYGFDNGYARLNGATGQNEDKYSLVEPGQWAVEFGYGIVKGIARCSTVGSGYTGGQTGNPTDDLNNADGAPYCWCQATSFTPQTFVYDTGNSNTAVYLTGYKHQGMCVNQLKSVLNINTTAANNLVNSASLDNPQLLNNISIEDAQYLSYCTTTSDAVGHFETGNSCSITGASWVYIANIGNTTGCSRECSLYCKNAITAYNDSSYRASVFGITQ